MSYFLVLIASLLLLLPSSYSFIYKILPNSPTTSLSSNLLYERIERVYGTNQGPTYGTQGDTYIHLKLHLNPISFKNNTEFILFSFTTETWDELMELQSHIGFMPCLQGGESEGAEGKALGGTSGATGDKRDETLFSNNPKIKEYVVQRYMLNYQIENTSYPNGTYSMTFPTLGNRLVSQNGTLEMKMKINYTTWIDTQVICCSAFEESTEMSMTGEFIVHNPYGYLPSILYGLLPFTGFLAFVYGLVTLIFLWLLYVYRKSSMFLQYSCAILLALGTLSTLLHFISLLVMNSNGNPICCPFDKILLASIIFNSLMRTFARLLLLIVCIGYGVIISHLPRTKHVLLGLLSFAYFISSLFDEILLNSNDCNLSITEIRGAHTGWSFAELICNLIFVTWIYAALEDIIKRLENEKQTSKLRMYQTLAKSLGVFIGFFSILTLLALGSHVGFLHWPVETQWVQLIVWPVMNILVAITISFLWRPCQGSNQYAFSMQLPSTESHIDDDDDDGTEKESSTNALVTEDEEVKFSIEDLDSIQDNVSPRRRHLSPERKKEDNNGNIQEANDEKET